MLVDIRHQSRFMRYTVLAGIIFLVSMMGCSDLDPLDELGTTYNATVRPYWNEDETNEVDVVFDLCDAGPPAVFEPVLPFDAAIDITTSPNALDFWVYGYQVRFRNNHGNYFEVTTGQYEDLTAAELPTLVPELNNLNYSFSTPVISANSTYSEDGLLIWSHGDILYYMDTFLAAQPFLGQLIGGTIPEEESSDFVYDMQLVLNCRFADVDETFEIETPWTPVHFLNVANCSSGE